MRDEFGAYLRSRRERVRPQEVGLSPAGPRRTPGLRREELAQLAAVSVDYVVRLEQGRLRPSESVLAALARALRLSAAEREALFTLGRPPLGWETARESLAGGARGAMADGEAAAGKGAGGGARREGAGGDGAGGGADGDGASGGADGDGAGGGARREGAGGDGAGGSARREGAGGDGAGGDGAGGWAGAGGGSLRPALVRIVEAVEPLPAYVLDATLDLLAWNSAAARLFGGLDGLPNIARLVFTDAGYRARLVAPGEVEAEAAGALRLGLTRDPANARLRALAEELLDASPAFAALWAAQDVRDKTHGRKAFTHPEVGAFELEWERLTVPGEAGLALMVYSAQPGSIAATALSRLGMLSSALV